MSPPSEARRKPATTSGPRLGAYGRKHPPERLTPGHARVLRGRTTGPATSAARPRKARFLDQDFFVFCVKHILTSGNLVRREGRNWSLRENVGGVDPGEPFTNLDACASAIISAMRARYEREAQGEVAA